MHTLDMENLLKNDQQLTYRKQRWKIKIQYPGKYNNTTTTG